MPEEDKVLMSEKFEDSRYDQDGGQEGLGSFLEAESDSYESVSEDGDVDDSPDSMKTSNKKALLKSRSRLEDETQGNDIFQQNEEDSRHDETQGNDIFQQNEEDSRHDETQGNDIFQQNEENSRYDQENEQESLGSVPEAESESYKSISQDEEDVDDSPDLMKPSNKKALLELRSMLEDAIQGNHIFNTNETKKKAPDKNENKTNIDHSEITLWGIPLLPSKGHEGTDTILTKFLMAKDFKVSDAFESLKKTLKWRKEINIEGILEEKFDPDIECLGYLNGRDIAGRPLCYCLYRQFKDREIYKKIFASEKSSQEFLRWRIQFMERCIQTLSFKPGEPDTVLQIIDLKNIGPAIKHARTIAKKWMFLYQEHYPCLVFKTIILYVPLWAHAFHSIHLKFLTPRSKRKIILVRSSRVTETLLKYIDPQNLAVEYGGLMRKNDELFSADDRVLEHHFRGGSTESIEIYLDQAGETVIWEANVTGHDIGYKEEFVPDDEGSYNVLLTKEKKLLKSAKNSFHIREPGKIVITVENRTYKKKIIYYRYKTMPTDIDVSNL